MKTMQNNLVVVLAVLCAMFIVCTPSAQAEPINVWSRDIPAGDPLSVNGWVHELGDQPAFPNDEWIVSSCEPTDYRPCLESPDNPNIPNYKISITNMTGRNWPEVYYIADWDSEVLNVDGYIDPVGAPIWPAGAIAFEIDAVGVNTPLIYESVTWNGIFEAGETWQFVIQDFRGTQGGPPVPFDEIGIGYFANGWPPATGSIIAIPEPATLSLLGLGGLAMMRRRRQGS